MQKTVLFGISTQPQQQNPNQSQNHFCPHCLKLQKEVEELRFLLSQKEQSNTEQGFNQPVENETMKLLQIQLQDIKEKYLAFRKKVKLIEKENQSLFQENSRLQKELQTQRIRLRDLQEANTPIKKQKQPRQKSQKRLEVVSSQKECKKLEIQIFVWRQKTERLQILLKTQSDEVIRLKELLKKRNRLQEERHKLLSVLV